MSQKAILDNKSLENINRYALITINVSDWAADIYNNENCYKSVKELTGSTSSDSHPYIGLNIEKQSNMEELINNFNLIYDAYAGDNNITFYAVEKPSLNLSIQIKGW